MSDQEKNTNNLDQPKNTENLNNTPITEAAPEAEKPKVQRKPRKKPSAAEENKVVETVVKKDTLDENPKPQNATGKKPASKESSAQESQISVPADGADVAIDKPKVQRKPRKKPEPLPPAKEEASVTKISEEEFADLAEEEEAVASILEIMPSNKKIEQMPEADAHEENEEFVIIAEDGNVSFELPEAIDAECTEEEDRILPPDEIFSVPAKKKEEVPTEPEEECIDEDGQYRFASIEDKFEPEDEEEPIEFDYSEPTQEKYNEKKPRKIDGKFDFLELFVFTFLAVILVTSFLFKHSVVDGPSMESTLSSGEHLIISDLFYSPKRGDVIVCEDYGTDIRKPIVKRVIGVAGDTVKVTECGMSCIVEVNGVQIDESDYVHIDGLLTDHGRTYVSVFEVGEGELFIMGDHRNNSTDSRDIGCVSVDSVLGRVVLRFYPFNKFGTVD